MNIQRLTILLAVLCICTFSFGQKAKNSNSPYEITRKKDIPLLSVGLGLKITGEVMKRRVNRLSNQDVLALNTSDVLAFDRTATDNNSATARDWSDVLQYSSYGFSLLLLLDKNNKNDFLTIGTMALEVWSINSGLTNITKSLVKRPRPFVFNEDIELSQRTKSTSRLSFFSGHTSKVASMSFFTAQLFNDYYPDSKWKPVVWSAAVLLPATTGYLRYRGGRHYPSDVMIGFAAGALVGLAIPRLHRKAANKKLGLTVAPAANGLSLAMTW